MERTKKQASQDKQERRHGRKAQTEGTEEKHRKKEERKLGRKGRKEGS